MEWAWFILIVAGFLLFAAFANWVCRAPPTADPGWGNDGELALAYRVLQVYSRVFHRLRVVGEERLGAVAAARPLILVANHTAGVDPLLIQAACAFPIAWVMAEDMAKPGLEPLWLLGRVIKIDRATGDTRGVREALRRLRDGGVIGVFPEGHIARPARTILPFQPGVGLFIARTGASVLPVIIDGTPQVDPAWASLWRTSHACVRFCPPIRFEREPGKPAPHAHQIAEALRQVFLRETGWPALEGTDAEGV